MQRGSNQITRNSSESAITIPFEATFRNVDLNRPADSDLQNVASFSYCGCGWPQHMLVPKGTENGFPMDLFVMVSDYQQDRVIIFCELCVIVDRLFSTILQFDCRLIKPSQQVVVTESASAAWGIVNTLIDVEWASRSTVGHARVLIRWTISSLLTWQCNRSPFDSPIPYDLASRVIIVMFSRSNVCSTLKLINFSILCAVQVNWKILR